MKFLILFALVAAAAADYHDDTFHFSSTASVSGLTGLQKSAVVQTATPVITKKYTTVSAPAVARQYTTVQAETPVFSSFVSQQPAYTQQYQQYQQYKQVASPVLVKSIEEEIPAYSQQYTVKQFQQPAVYNQQYTVKQFQQPAVYNQQYAVKQVVQPVYSQQYAVKQVAKPVYTQYSAVQEVAKPVYSQYSAVKEITKPVYTQYSAVQEVAKPVYSQYSAVKEITKPVYTQYSAVQEAAKPVYSQYSAIKEVAKPIAVSQYSANNLYSQQYSDSVSTYANAYNGPQFRILSQVQEADPAGPYKLSYSTENGIQATEQGSLVAGAEGGVVASQGSYSYTGPDGVVYTVNYIADENGFRASGAHLPTPPAIPAEILKSLEENAASGEQYDDQGRLIYKN